MHLQKIENYSITAWLYWELENEPLNMKWCNFWEPEAITKSLDFYEECRFNFETYIHGRYSNYA